MFKRRGRARWALGVGSAAVLALAAAGLTAGTAHASTGIDIDGLGVTTAQINTGRTACQTAGYAVLNLSNTWSYCLFYSPNFANGIVWGSHNQTTPTISGDFYQIVFPVGGGYAITTTSHPVRNDAASMFDDTTACNVTTWVSPNYVGNYNWLTANTGGNLTDSSNTNTGAYLRNNEAAISYNNCP